MDDGLIERLAAIEHERWSDWQKYCHSCCTKNPDGSLTIPADKVAHWEKQIATPYHELSLSEQSSDKHQVNRYARLIDEEVQWRRALWLRHGCDPNGLYGDDGEMQCGQCMVDFKRGSIVDIVNTLFKHMHKHDSFWKAFYRKLNAFCYSLKKGPSPESPHPDVHHIKINPIAFEALLVGKKRHEVRTHDRDYKTGDIVILEEYLTETKQHSGRKFKTIIGWISKDSDGLLPPGTCVFSLL